jgi:hypothetical protein
MKLTDRISLHLIEVKPIGLGAFLIFVLAVGYASLSSVSVPTGKETLRMGVIESVGITQDSALQLAHSTVLVKLASGQYATVHVPRSVVVSPGQHVKVREIHETMGKSFSIVAEDSHAQ